MANGFSVSVQADVRKATGYLNFIEKSVINKATVRALNVGIRKTQSVGVKAMSKAVGVKQKELRKKLRIIRASPKRKTSEVRFNVRGFNPITLGFAPNKALAFYKGPTAGKPFYMTMPNSSTQIVVRLPSSTSSEGLDTKGRLRRGRLPVASIRVRIGRDGAKEMNAALNNEGHEAFVNEYYRQLKLLTKS